MNASSKAVITEICPKIWCMDTSMFSAARVSDSSTPSGSLCQCITPLPDKLFQRPVLQIPHSSVPLSAHWRASTSLLQQGAER